MLGIAATISQAGIDTLNHAKPFSRMTTALGNSFAKFNPVQSLSDEQYESLMRDKLLKIDVEIALLDDQIAKLQATQGKPPTSRPLEGVGRPS
jgi:hypothetical protein